MCDWGGGQWHPATDENRACKPYTGVLKLGPNANSRRASPQDAVSIFVPTSSSKLTTTLCTGMTPTHHTSTVLSAQQAN